MSFFEWSTKYDLGVKDMNDEHQKLIGIMNLLFSKNEEKAPASELSKLMKELADYTTKHFQDEEAYMQSIQYPDLARHRLIHQNLLEKLSVHVTEFKKTQALSKGFFEFLKFWLSAHIQGIDMKYGEFSRQRQTG